MVVIPKRSLETMRELNFLTLKFTFNYYNTKIYSRVIVEVREQRLSVFNTLRTGLLNCLNARSRGLTLGTALPLYRDRRFAALQRKLFIYLINKYIPLSDICLTVHH